MNFCNLIIALLLLEASKNKVNLLVNVIALFVVTCKSYQNSKPDRQGIKNLCCGIDPNLNETRTEKYHF